MPKPPTSRLSRLSKLGSLTSRVGGSYLGERIRSAFSSEDESKERLDRLHIENARRVAETMGQLKGAAMKVGQSLALALDNIDMPDEVAGALRQLNDKAEPVEFAIIKEDVESSLELRLEEAFASFDPEPLGTASLGQAHAATLHTGEQVVVKVLHRGVKDAVGADLGAMRTMFVTGRILRRDKREIEMIFDELRERLEEELDYYAEAANLEYFKAQLAHIPGLRVPGTIPSHCTDRVLTMERLGGVPLEQFLESADRKARQRAGLALVRAIHVMIYRLRAVHADPHEGNFLFEPDGTVGLLDFGCVKRFDLYWLADYCRLAKAGLAEDREQALQILRKMDSLCTDDPEAADIIWQTAWTMCKPFRGGKLELGSPEDDATERIQRLTPRILRHPQGVRTTRDMIYLHRALGGIYAMGRRMHLEADFGAVAVPYLEACIAEAEGRPIPEGVD